VKLVLTTDAHSPACLSHLEYAVATARRGWVCAKDVLNCQGAEAFRASLRRK
jgi:DNA polymerase (family 10)